MTESRPPSRPPRYFWPLAVAVFAAHVGLVLWHFPASLADPERPLATGDSAITLGKAWDTARGTEAGGLYGYSPSYMAGYPYGLWNSVAHRGYEAGTAYLPVGGPPERYYLTALGMALLTPLLVGLAARACGYSWAATVGSLAAACVVYQVCDPVSYFWTFGNVGFPFACGLAVVAVALALPGPGGRTFPRAAAAGLAAGAAVWVHTLAAVPLACGGVTALVVGLRVGVWWPKLLAAACVAVGVAAALTVPAYWHLLGHLDARAATVGQPLPSGVKYLAMDFLNDRAYQHPLDRRPLFHLLFVLAAWQGWADWRARAGRCEGLWLAGTLTLLFAYASGHVPALTELQPYRFVVAGDLLLTVPAALGLARLATALRAANPPGRVAFVVAAVAFLPSLTGYGWDLAARPRAQPLPPDDQRCVEWVREHHTAGRVLCEPSAAGCLLPHLTGCEVIGGGVSNYSVVVQGWTHVGDGRAFGRPIETMTAADFRHWCRMFDVRLVVVESAALEALVTAGGDAARVADAGRYRLYRLAVEPVAPVWEGCYQGRVRAAHNRIVIDNPPAGRVVLNYHHARGFDGGPGVEVAPVDVGGGAPLLGVTVAAPADRVELVFRP